ncbi:MAG: hypothetical protein JNL21_26080 [Myxococcales bacterium]|nr:hypothetical protein [Myxococcales bacterium]
MATKRAASSKTPTKPSPKKNAPAKKAQKPSLKKASAKKAPRRTAQSMELKQVSPYTPNPNLFAFYQLVQNGNEAGLVYVKGTGARNCTETWQLYNTSAAGVGTGYNGLRRGYYTFPSFQNRTGESTDVTTRYIYIGTREAVLAPSGLNATQYQTVTAVCS